jgi:hypothetical protein
MGETNIPSLSDKASGLAHGLANKALASLLANEKITTQGLPAFDKVVVLACDKTCDLHQRLLKSDDKLEPCHEICRQFEGFLNDWRPQN